MNTGVTGGTCMKTGSFEGVKVCGEFKNKVLDLA